MAKIEEVTEQSGGDDRWKAQQIAHKLDGEIQQLKVALSELDAVKPKRTTYTKKANVFFLDRRDNIVKTKKHELKNKEKKRHDVGLELRN
ncbi:hypothetical protein PRIC1_009339 [Phytophthora ramorum]|uniref:uncharacterized protein n=1 Tax=Phytophthora ramorum TaxID=164328 RepID=UPI0030A9B1AF|nr:hypothetical protein KRP23_5906 [Phytophthora ramorum]KAH7504803.1 hypothetical protein KRP22_5286 [Phytophthora ramorum]